MGLLQAEGASAFMGKVLIKLDPEDFVKLAREVGSESVVIHSVSKPLIMGKETHKYVLPLHGVLFFCRSREELDLPGEVRVVDVRNFSYPGI